MTAALECVWITAPAPRRKHVVQVNISVSIEKKFSITFPSHIPLEFVQIRKSP